MQKDNLEKFVFSPVTTLPHYINYILGFTIGVPMFYLYSETGFRYFGTWGLVFTFFLFAIIMILIIKYFMEKSVIVYFSNNYIHIQDSNKEPKKYLKSDIEGFFSYDYESVQKSFISIQIKLKNGDKINLIDTSTSQKIDVKKAQMLEHFFKVAKKELGFVYKDKSNLRWLQKLGACWYAKE